MRRTSRSRGREKDRMRMRMKLQNSERGALPWEPRTYWNGAVVVRPKRSEDYEHCKTIFIIIDYISVRGEACEVNGITYAWDAITIIVPLRACVCARASVGANDCCRTRLDAYIRVYPEIVYRFVGFPIGKQSHPSANERVTFTPPPVVLARSFNTCARESTKAALSQYKTIREILLSVTRNSTFFYGTSRWDTIKAEIGYEMREPGCVVLISPVGYRWAWTREDSCGKYRVAYRMRERCDKRFRRVSDSFFALFAPRLSYFGGDFE